MILKVKDFKLLSIFQLLVKYILQFHLLLSKNLPKMADNDPKNVQDLTVFVQQVLQDMQGKFKSMSDGVVNKIEDMGGRIDELERNIAELLAQAGVEEEELNSTEKL